MLYEQTDSLDYSIYLHIPELKTTYNKLNINNPENAVNT